LKKSEDLMRILKAGERKMMLFKEQWTPYVDLMGE
jgi:hypothetical protein